MPKTDTPIACALSKEELRRREETALKSFFAQIRRVEGRPDGYAIEVNVTDEGLASVLDLIQVERICCPFLRFDLTVEPDGERVQLTITGAPGTKDFLAHWLEPLAARDV